MRDGRALSIVKQVVRLLMTLEFGLRRRLRGKARYELRGACEGCAKCCETPSISVGPITWHFPTVQKLFLAYQFAVNGFEYVAKERSTKTFAFRCTHFDEETRRCDSYETRPFMCRDYPRLLLEQAAPDLFDECGFRAFDTQGARLSEAIDSAHLAPELREKLRRRLHLYDGPSGTSACRDERRDADL